MPVFKDKTKEIIVKVVYYGPGLSGKSTSLKSLHEQTLPDRRGDLHVWGNEADTILDFELMAPSRNEIKKYQLRFQVFTIPGQVKSNRTRKFVLEGVDAIVFVADSQKSTHKANIISMGNLKENLRANSVNLNDIPMVFEYNKRDLRGVLPVSELNHDLNPTDRYPVIETVATKGHGVGKTFEIISNLVIQSLSRQIELFEEETPEEFSELTGLSGFDEEFDFAAELTPTPEIEQVQPPFAAGDAIVETYHDGEIIFEVGDAGDRMYFIESGQVKIVAPSQTKQMLAVYRPGEFFGEMALFGKDFRSTRAVAIGTTNLLPVTSDRLGAQIQNRPQIAKAFLATLSDRVRKENENITKLLEQNTELLARLQQSQAESKQMMGRQEEGNFIELTFKQGIDWQAFVSAFQHLRRQITAKRRGANFTAQGLAMTREGDMIIKVITPQGMNQEKLSRAFHAQYKQYATLYKTKYQRVWQGKEQVLAVCRQQGADLQKILTTLSQTQTVHTTLIQAIDPKQLAQLRKVEEWKYVYLLLNQKVSELRRRYINEPDPATRLKLKKHIKITEATLLKIEQRLEKAK